ncbi:MAG: glycine betaine ABC transporter substrate-binding protein [Dehalococcoidia bacterium]|nr:glycine betaine ABC transporter substrate-binding protein [Dehalococcoidia bacterium]
MARKMVFLGMAAFIGLVVGCSGGEIDTETTPMSTEPLALDPSPQPTPLTDLSEPTLEVPSPTPPADIEATVAARVSATQQAKSTSTSTPIPSPTPEPTATLVPVPTGDEEVKPTINFGDSLFESLWINNAIAEFVIEAAYGNPVETIQMPTPIMQTSLANGEIDVVMELWHESIIDWYDKEIANGTIANLGQTYEGSPQFFIVPTYTAEEFGIVTIEDMKKPEVVAALADPEDPAKGAFNNCIGGWQCAAINRAKFQAYGLDEFYNIITPGNTGAMDAGLSGPQIANQHTFGYYWAPTSLFGLYDWTVIEEPVYTDTCWHEVIIGRDDASYTPEEACAYETFPIDKGINTGLNEKAPDVVAMLEKMNVGVGPTSKTAAWALTNEVDVSVDKVATAQYYLENFKDIWTQWMDDDAVQDVKDALAEL